MSIDQSLYVVDQTELKKRLGETVSPEFIDNIKWLEGVNEDLQISDLCEILHGCQTDNFLDQYIDSETAKHIFSSFFPDQTKGKTAFGGYYQPFEGTFERS